MIETYSSCSFGIERENLGGLSAIDYRKLLICVLTITRFGTLLGHMTFYELDTVHRLVFGKTDQFHRSYGKLCLQGFVVQCLYVISFDMALKRGGFLHSLARCLHNPLVSRLQSKWRIIRGLPFSTTVSAQTAIASTTCWAIASKVASYHYLLAGTFYGKETRRTFATLLALYTLSGTWLRTFFRAMARLPKDGKR